MTRNSYIVFVLASLLTFSIYSAKAQIDQQSVNLQNVIPPSPNATSIAKYTDWPVNLYTGVPNIDIPVYTLKGRGLSVPISLSYHATGIKVGENASNVGLGWSLMAGGVITRCVRGLADDDPGGMGYLQLRSYYKNPGDLSSGTTATGSSAYADSNIQVSVANGNADSQPDLFMFNALGRSYKFIFLGNGTIVTQPFSNVRITFNSTSSTVSSWVVTLEDGTKLLFGGNNSFEEVTTTVESASASDAFISSWYLQSITSATGEVINFTYTSKASVNMDSYFYESDYLLYQVAVNNLSSGVPVTLKLPKTIGQKSVMNILTPATIESDLCRVYFDTVTRLDLLGTVAVSDIKIYSKTQNQFLKTYYLHYGYSTATAGNSYSTGYTTTPYRLKLDSLEEAPMDNSPHKYWQLAYNPLTLPSKESYAQDWWGYYNKATTNTTMKPFVINFNPDNYPYANRSADSDSMMAEMLTQVTYPTGGYSLFTYEPNSYPANEEQFQNVPINLSLYLAYNQSNFTNTTSTTFTIDKVQYFKLQFLGIFSASYLQDFGPNTTLATAVLNNSSGSSAIAMSLKAANSGTAVTSISVLLNPGTYTLTMSSISTQADFSTSAQTVSLSASSTYSGSLGIQAVNHKVGGVRIKKITYYDNVDNTKPIIKNYTYQGANIAYPVDTANDYVGFVTDNNYDCGAPDGVTPCGLPCLATSIIYYGRNSSTKFGLGTIQGGTVGYSTVTESFGATGQDGINVYHYSFASDLYIPASKGFPYPPITSLDYERGLLQEKDVYTAGGVPVSKEFNTYQFINKGSVKAYKVAYSFNILSACFTFTYLSNFLTRAFYTDQTNQIQHTSSTQVLYNTATGDSLVKTTNYYYDDTLNTEPTRTVTFNSRGDSVLTYQRTALELSSINASIPLTTIATVAIDTMQARNMVGIPIESEKYTKSILTDKALTNYKLESNGYVQPDNVMVQNAANTLETRVFFPRYDIKGNMLEQMKANDARHDYIWDYQYTYPIAEVVNADSSSIAYTSFEADGTGNWTVGSSARDSTTPAITGYKSYNLSSGAISTSVALLAANTYTVSYWSKGGSFTVTSGGTPKQGKTIMVNGTAWTYYEHTITGVTSISITGTTNIDELRLYRAGAQMTTYTYTPLVGISSQCDINNRITYYQYDGFNQLYTILDQDRNVLKKFCYNYSGQNIACSQFYNNAKSGIFTRNNCGAGYTGSAVTYTVPANTYASLISQGAADTLALNDVNTNGQAYANNPVNGGTCTATGFAITATNYTNIAGFTATFTNLSTNAQTVLTIPAAGGNIGTMPAATYKVVIAKSGNTTKYLYSMCSSVLAAATVGTFNSITISSSCNTLTIDTTN